MEEADMARDADKPKPYTDEAERVAEIYSQFDPTKHNVEMLKAEIVSILREQVAAAWKAYDLIVEQNRQLNEENHDLLESLGAAERERDEARAERDYLRRTPTDDLLATDVMYHALAEMHAEALAREGALREALETARGYKRAAAELTAESQRMGEYPRTLTAKSLREIADFLGHVALNGVDAKDREVALALEQDARALATHAEPMDD